MNCKITSIMMVQCLALLPHSKMVLGSIPLWNLHICCMSALVYQRSGLGALNHLHISFIWTSKAGLTPGPILLSLHITYFILFQWKKLAKYGKSLYLTRWLPNSSPSLKEWGLFFEYHHYGQIWLLPTKAPFCLDYCRELYNDISQASFLHLWSF